jgi:outer membrane protein insertion porin family
VTPQYERIASSNAVILVFKIEEGPKVKVGQIKFKGNHAFSDRKLIRAMRHDRPYAIPMYFFEISVLSKTYDRQKLNDLQARDQLGHGHSRATPSLSRPTVNNELSGAGSPGVARAVPRCRTNCAS